MVGWGYSLVFKLVSGDIPSPYVDTPGFPYIPKQSS